MSLWLFFALVAPLLFGVGGVLDKFMRDRHLSTFNLSIVTGISWFWVVALLPFIGFDFGAASVVVVLAGFFAGVLLFANGFPYFHALSLEEASRVVPLWSLSSVMVLVIAFFFLGERLGFYDFAGFVLVVAGAFLVSSSNLAGVFRPGKVFFLMSVACFFTSVSFVIAKWLYGFASFWEVAFFLGLGIAVSALVVLVVSGRSVVFVRDIFNLRKAFFVLLLRELTLVCGMLAFGFALMLGSASLTSALSELAGFFTFVFAVFLSFRLPGFFVERVDKKTLLTKALAIAMIVAGVFAISL